MNGQLDHLILSEASDISVAEYLVKNGIPDAIKEKFLENCIDGIPFCLISESDLHEMGIKQIGLRKKILYLSTLWRRSLEKQQFDTKYLSFGDCSKECNMYESLLHAKNYSPNKRALNNNPTVLSFFNDDECTVVEHNTSFWKLFIAFLYFFLSTGITSFVMVLAHERLPDISKYPPLPDLFLDNLPHISWGFVAAELVGIVLSVIWLIILIFHKYRWILLRRCFVLFGTVLFLRCITMLITSLSVPGRHLAEHCSPYKIENSHKRIERILAIWLNMGLSVSGIQTCGDYMFSGHTTCLTLLNFFITEYSPRKLQALHTFCWVLNLFGIFFILASHEHYSIDVFVAVYVSSRLFLYYHCLANSNILYQKDKERTMIWFPLFSYFEYDVRSIVPNVYENSVRNVYNHIFKSDLSAYYKKHDSEIDECKTSSGYVNHIPPLVNHKCDTLPNQCSEKDGSNKLDI